MKKEKLIYLIKKLYKNHRATHDYLNEITENALLKHITEDIKTHYRCPTCSCSECDASAYVSTRNFTLTCSRCGNMSMHKFSKETLDKHSVDFVNELNGLDYKDFLLLDLLSDDV